MCSRKLSKLKEAIKYFRDVRSNLFLYRNN